MQKPAKLAVIRKLRKIFRGTIDLVSIFGASIGDTQFKQLMVLASILLMSCILITCFSVEERVLITRRYTSQWEFNFVVADYEPPGNPMKVRVCFKFLPSSGRRCGISRLGYGTCVWFFSGPG